MFHSTETDSVQYHFQDSNPTSFARTAISGLAVSLNAPQREKKKFARQVPPTLPASSRNTLISIQTRFIFHFPGPSSLLPHHVTPFSITQASLLQASPLLQASNATDVPSYNLSSSPLINRQQCIPPSPPSPSSSSSSSSHSSSTSIHSSPSLTTHVC